MLEVIKGEIRVGEDVVSIEGWMLACALDLHDGENIGGTSSMF